MPSILGGGAVIADALVLGTPRISTVVDLGTEVGVGVEVGAVAVFLVNRYPLTPTIIKKIIMMKINFLLFFEIEILLVGCRIFCSIA